MTKFTEFDIVGEETTTFYNKYWNCMQFSVASVAPAFCARPPPPVQCSGVQVPPPELLSGARASR